MSAEDTAAMRATLDGLVREQSERRALRDQRADEIKASSQEFMTKQVQTAQRYVEHRRELGQRKTKSGWSTDRSHAQPGNTSAFEDDSVDMAAPFGSEPPPVPAGRDTPRRAPRARPAPADDEDDAFLNNRWRD